MYDYNDEIRSVASYTDSVIDGLADCIRRRESLPEFSVVLAECSNEAILLAPRALCPLPAREAVVLRHFFGAGGWGNAALVRRHYLNYF